MNLNYWLASTLAELAPYVRSELDIDDFVDWTINRYNNERTQLSPADEVEVWLDLKEEA